MTTRPIQLLDRSITYESAARREDNILHQISWVSATRELYRYLWYPPQRKIIATLTAHHLGLDEADDTQDDPRAQQVRCIVQKPEHWLRGSFNVCVPVHVHNSAGAVTRKVLMRFPMPHKLAEHSYPGTVDEKLNCEIATYAWMQDHCPEIPTAHLIGFGFSDGSKYTHAVHLPPLLRWARKLRRFFCNLVGLPVPSLYVRQPTRLSLRTGYLLLDFVDPTVGQMLSLSWDKASCDDSPKRSNLFRGIARLILALAHVPLPRIGAFEFHDDGTLTLTNRPLTCGIMIHENDGAPRVLETKTTYPCVDPYIADLLTFHDERFMAQQYAANNEQDCRFQMAIQALLRTVSHHYYDRNTRYGPFVMQFTDLHQSNILVDEDWNITALIDLEWFCSRPAFMLDVPYWISGHSIDEIGEEENTDAYRASREAFMRILDEEEGLRRGRPGQPSLRMGPVMQEAWQTGACWFAHCLDSVDAMYPLFDQHLRPHYAPFFLTERMEAFMSRFWRGDGDEVVATKLKQRESYNSQLKAAFQGEEGGI